MPSVVEMIYFTAFVTLYFTPAIVAFYRAKPSRLGIAFLNLIAGWTMIRLNRRQWRAWQRSCAAIWATTVTYCWAHVRFIRGSRGRSPRVWPSS